MHLDLEALATKAGTDGEKVRYLSRLGVIPATDQLEERAVPLIRLLLTLEESGVSLEDLAGVVASGALSLENIDRAFIRTVGMRPESFSQLAEQWDVSSSFAEDLQIALGIPARDDGLVREDDAETLRLLSRMVALGVSEAITASLFQIMADNLRKMASASSEMWAAGIQAPLLEAGMSYGEIVEAQNLNGAELQDIGERVVVNVWKRFLEDEIFSGTVEILEMALEEAGVSRGKVAHPPAIAFMDLTAFTALTDRDGDDVAAAGARNLGEILRRLAVGWQGTLVKMLGDGAMLHFSDPSSAVGCALALVEEIPAAGLPPARFGVNAGPVILRDVDYYGNTVNVAARLVDYARPREVLVTSTVVEASDDEDLRFDEIGPVSLKGVAEPVAVFSASRRA